LKSEQAFLDWLGAHLEQHQYELVIPVTERSLLPLHKNRQRFEHVRIAMAEEHSLEMVLDKAKTFKLAEELGISVPRSHYLSDLEQLEPVMGSLTYPTVVKPSQSVSGQNEGYTRNSVSYATDAASLARLCRLRLKHSPVILQSYFKGVGVGVELIADKGDVLYAFQHLRLHELPLSGGGSSFRVSTDLEPELLEASRQLMRSLEWTGVAMVEFKWNADSRTYCLMEINGRFWGSLPLALAAGADFPAMLAELLLEGNIKQHPDYRRAVFSRNLAKDLAWHEAVLRSSSNPVTKIPTATEVVSDLAKLFSPRHRFDVQSVRDPVPGLLEMGQLGSTYAKRLSDTLVTFCYTRHQQLMWRNGKVREQTRSAGNILFICYGNINRSAVAAELLKSYLPSQPDLSVHSSGFHQHVERPTDPIMSEIALAHGLDMALHRSSSISEQMLRTSDIIFVMEKTHRDRLLELAPACAGRIFLLGAEPHSRAAGGAEIHDPYNRSREQYAQCFERIRLAVRALADDLYDH
jgi:protein-tyrosine-phosphatase/predicted ATP-grasp superfamily ATP-dependent carboligase